LDRRWRVVTLRGVGLDVCWVLPVLAAVLAGSVLPAASLIAALATMGLAETLFVPVVFTLVNELAPAELRGRYNGAVWAVTGAAFAAGPLAGGWLVGAHLASAWLALLVAAAAAVVVLATRLSPELEHAAA
jgi:MFS family permease